MIPGGADRGRLASQISQTVPFIIETGPLGRLDCGLWRSVPEPVAQIDATAALETLRRHLRAKWRH